MLSTLNIRLVNGLGGDPAVYVQPHQSSDCLLFDAGSLENLTARELLKIRVVAISHTHLDHFVGFDRLIRVNVPHFRTIEVIGPTGIITNIRSKLGGYTWNLLESGQLNFVVHEINLSGQAIAVKLTNDNNFEPIALDLYSNTQSTADKVSVTDIKLTTLHGPQMRAITVDHGTAVLAFCLEMPTSNAVSKSSLEQLNLTPGPWISQLQRLVARNELSGHISVEGKNFFAKDLVEKILMPRPGEKLMYVTDMIFRDDNLERLIKLASGGVDLLVCESNFLNSDRHKAQKKFHLTAHQAALLAVVINAKNLQVFHISNIYADNFSAAEEEASQSLTTLRQCDHDELNLQLSMEFAQHPQKAISLVT